MKYVPLHIHTEYSLGKSIIKIKELCEYAKAQGFPAVAITDNSVMYGAMEFYKTAKEYDIKPIIGCEFYIFDGKLEIKDRFNNTLYHLVLLAKNEIGYKNLIKLSSISWCEGFYCKPRINWELLQKYHEGLICLSTCVNSEIAQKFLSGNKEEAENIAIKYQNLFKDDFYIELQNHNLEEEQTVNKFFIELVKKLAIKPVITNNSYYLNKQDASCHDTFLCEYEGTLKNDENRDKFFNDEFYVKDIDELKRAFLFLDERCFNNCIETSVEIANKCNFKFNENSDNYFPKSSCPNGINENEYLNELCIKGLREKYHDSIPDDIFKRYQEEKGLILKTNTTSIFLLIWDIINFAKENQIEYNEPFGGIFNLITTFALGIVKNVPNYTENNAEQILNKFYDKPSINIDFNKNLVGEIIDYIVKKLGKYHVAKSISFTSFTPKTAMQLVCNAYNKAETEINSNKNLLHEVTRLTGMKKLYRTNNSNIIISPILFQEIVPIQLDQYGDVVIQYPKDVIQKFGLFEIKFTENKYHEKTKLLKYLNSLDDLSNLYTEDFVNYKGVTKDCFKELYTEIVAGFVLDNLTKDKEIRNIKKISRIKNSYYTETHNYPKTNHKSPRKEENFVKGLFTDNIFKNSLGEIIDYQIPLKDSQKDSTGKIDFITYKKDTNELFLAEIKINKDKKEKEETALRCCLEIQTYFQTVDKKKLVTDYMNNAHIQISSDVNIKKAVVVPTNSQADNEFKEAVEEEQTKRPNLKRIINDFDIKIVRF